METDEGNGYAVVEHKLAVLDMRGKMLDGFLNENPSKLRKFSSEVLAQSTDLELALNDLPDDPRKMAYHETIVKIRQKAVLFFEAANGIDFSSPSVPTTVESAAGADLFKLRKCAPPTFSGNYRDFPQWWEHFDKSVHSNPAVMTEVKIIHLMASFRGPAKEFLRGYPSTAEHYERAIADIHTRYGDKTKLAQCFFSDLAELPDLASNDDVTLKQDRSNLDAIKTLVLSLRTTGKYDTELTQGLILRKMSRLRVRDAFIRLSVEFPKLDFTLDKLLEALETSLYIDEVIELRSVNVNKEYAAASDEVTQKMTTLMVKSKTNRNQPSSSSSSKSVALCMFCEGKHASTDCTRYRSFGARKQRVTELGRCYKCLSSDHRSNSCPNENRRCRTCDKAGHCSPLCWTAIERLESKHGKRSSSVPPRRGERRRECKDLRRKGGDRSKSQAERPKDGRDAANASSSGTFLETFVSTISIRDRSTTIRGLLDGCSNASYLHEDVLRRLGVKALRNLRLNVQSYGSSSVSEKPTASIEVTFTGLHGNTIGCKLFTSDCIVNDAILSPPPSEVASLLPYEFEYADTDIFCDFKRPIEVLLGNDLRNLFVKINRDKILHPGLLFKPTFFGWIPSGKAVVQRVSTVTSLTTKASDARSAKPEFLNSPPVTSLWELEALGIRESELSETNDVVIERFRQTTRIENNRYVVTWPRKSEKLNLASNYRMCVARLKALLRSTPKDILVRWDNVITEQLSSRIIEPAPRDNCSVVHYLPHHPVLRKDKIRIVYDASAKTKSGSSLNDSLHAGPVLTRSLLEILLNFRLKEIGITSDIQSAFLQVGLDEPDRDLVRFLWVNDISQSPDDVRFVHYRFTRTPFGVVSSPFLLNMVLSDLLADEDNESCLLARKRFYVDNLVVSVRNTIHAMELFESVSSRLAAVSMNLRDWASNSTEFVNALPPEKLMADEGIISILGVNWSRRDDKMSLKFKEEEKPSSITLRSALSALASVYDPIGLCAPCVLDLKLFVQQCWREKAGWDSPLPPILEARYRKLILEREEIKQISFPRYLWSSSSEKGTYELHVFCDASKVAFGCALYLVHKVPGKSEAQLILTKVRVAPIKQRSIPQLELLGVVLGKRQATLVRQCLDVSLDRTFIWTDATTVLQWLKSVVEQTRFVQSRLEELRKTPDVIFRYTPSKDNPADILTRGLRASILGGNALYWHGPSWLTQERLWPSAPPNTAEFIAEFSRLTLSARSSPIEIPFVNDKYESRATNWDKCVQRICRIPPLAALYRKQVLSSTQIFHRAELVLIRLIQQRYFGKELINLAVGKDIDADLNLYLHSDGIIRCRGRLETAPLDWDTANPIFLPRQSPLVRLLMHKMHLIMGHSGTETTLVKFRTRFWITRARVVVRQVIHRCQICRRWRGGPFQLPKMPPLPLERFAPIAPFVNIGLDCFGPMQVRPPYSSAPTVHKVYGVIFTCLVTRAIHLELAENLSGDKFLQCLERFVSRRGVPNFIVSDNGTNLTFVQPLLGQQVELTHEALKDFVVNNGINWHFIPSYSPWQGGVYEKMISLVKSALLRIIGSKILDYSTLHTTFCKVENIVNSRPLAPSATDEILQPLTPNHFLRPTSVLRKEDVNLDSKSLNPSTIKLLSGFKRVHSLVEQFRQIFVGRYLQYLRERHVANHPVQRGSVKFLPRIGDMVLVEDTKTSRAKWPVGVIEKLDRRNAYADVRIIDWSAMRKGNSKAERLTPYRTKVVNKCIKFLYPLEILPEEVGDQQSPSPKRRREADPESSAPLA